MLYLKPLSGPFSPCWLIFCSIFTFHKQLNLYLMIYLIISILWPVGSPTYSREPLLLSSLHQILPRGHRYYWSVQKMRSRGTPKNIYISVKGTAPPSSSKYLTLPTSPRSDCSILHYLPVWHSRQGEVGESQMFGRRRGGAVPSITDIYSLEYAEGHTYSF